MQDKIFAFVEPSFYGVKYVEYTKIRLQNSCNSKWQHNQSHMDIQMTTTT